MQECNDIVAKIYIHPDINTLISKIKPEGIRDDLKQEIALSLLEMPCDKVSALFAQDNLLRYAIKICWNMATGAGEFYKKYRHNDFKRAYDWMVLMQQGCSFTPSAINTVVIALQNKTQTVEDEHEATIFKKYAELGSSRAVAAYYNIPINHVCNVVAKVKKELKCILSQ